MHVQNRAFGNIGFQSTWVFGSHELEEHRNGEMVKLKSNHVKMKKNKNLIMPVMQLVLFFMHISLKRTSKWILKFLHFFFERDTKGKSSSFALLHS